MIGQDFDVQTLERISKLDGDSVIEALEELHAERLDPVLAQIAHHYCAAGRAGEADKAVEFAVRAGEQASYKLAYAEAVDFYTRALAVLSDHDGRRRRIMLRRAVAYMALTHTILDARVR